MGHYILKGREIQNVDLLTWGRWMEEHHKERQIKRTELPNGVLISTVFLGLDYNFGDEGPPLLFESMAWDTTKKEKYMLAGRERESVGEDLAQERYATIDEAEKGHELLIETYKSLRN